MKLLRDAQDAWGISQAEFAHREKLRLRERMKKRQQRARMKAPPMESELFTACAVPAFETFRLKGLDVQELGIVAVVTKTFKRPNPMSSYTSLISVPMSLPWVSMLHGPKAGSTR